MIRLFAAFLAPCVLYFFFLIYNIFIMIIHNNTISFSLEGVSWVYIFALPGYILIGIPCSLIIERVQKGLQWLYYILIGSLIGVLLNIIDIVNGESGSAQLFDWSIVWWYGVVAFAYYVSLKTFKWIDHKFQNSDT